MAKLTAKVVTGNLSLNTNWVGDVAPVNGDTIEIPLGADILVDVNITLGSKVAAVGNAVQIRGANVGSFGQLRVADGVTLTLRGQDRGQAADPFGNSCGWMEAFGRFKPLAGSTVLLDVATAGQSLFSMFGILDAIGTAAKRIKMGTPDANRNWNTAFGPTDVGFQFYEYYDDVNKIGAQEFGGPLSNAAGTGPGTFGDSSVSFSSVTPAGMLATPVASIEAITSFGKYYVDHDGGIIFFYLDKATASSFQFSVSGKRVTNIAAGFNAVADTDGNAVTTDYLDLVGLGNSEFGQFAMTLDNKYQAVGTLRGVSMKNTRFIYGRGLQIQKVIGTAAARVYFDDCEWQGCIGDGLGCDVVLREQPTAYLTFRRPVRRHAGGALFINSYGGTGITHDHLTLEDPAIWSSRMFGGQTIQNVTYPDMSVTGAFCPGNGGGGDSRQWANPGGGTDLAHPAIMSDSVIWRAMRGINYAQAFQFLDSVMGHVYHHTLNPPYGDNDIRVPGFKLKRVIEIRCGDALTDLGYNTRAMTDGAEVVHNTTWRPRFNVMSVNFSGTSSQSFNVGLLMASNLSSHSDSGTLRSADVVDRMVRLHVALWDYNNMHDVATALNGGLMNRLCTTTGVVNVTGVSLFNPTFAAPVAGKSLVFTRTSPTNQTLGFDGGAAVQLVHTNGACTGASNENTFGARVLRSYLDDTSKAWSNADLTNPATPVGTWLVMTSGVAAGAVRRVMDAPFGGTRLVCAEPWAAGQIPVAGDTYILLKSEVLLTGAAGTMNAGIDARVLPGVSAADAGVAVEFHTTTVDPMFVDPERDLRTWDLALGGPGTETSARNRIFNDPTLTRTSLLPHIRAGFVPTNAALPLGHDGVVVGAIPPAGGGGPGPAHHLTMTTQPSSPIGSGGSHVTQPQGNIVDASGVVTGSTLLVTATLVMESGTATPLGTNTVNAVAGHWDFTGRGLGATNTGVGPAAFHWVFSAPGMVSVSSASVTLNAAGGGGGGGGTGVLVFTRQPVGGVSGGLLTAQPRVESRVGGATDPTDTRHVTFTLVTLSGPGGIMSGTTSGNLVAGVFDPGDIHVAGAGTYEIAADFG